jgi:hypothetical protein
MTARVLKSSTNRLAIIVLLAACGGTLSSGQSGSSGPSGSGNDGGTFDTREKADASSAIDSSNIIEADTTTVRDIIDARDSAPASAQDTGSDGTPQSDLSGTWTGYVENFDFNDGSDAVTLAIGIGLLGGHATFGHWPAPKPPTDPNVGYPPGLQISPGPGTLDLPNPYPGFQFTLVNTSFDGQRLRFDISPMELWNVWCEMQTPILDDANAAMAYFCAHNWGFIAGSQGCSQRDPMTQQTVPLNCGQLALCGINSGVCVCTAKGCMGNLDATIHFDLLIAELNADGSVRGFDSDVHNVHLTKR